MMLTELLSSRREICSRVTRSSASFFGVSILQAAKNKSTIARNGPIRKLCSTLLHSSPATSIGAYDGHLGLVLPIM